MTTVRDGHLFDDNGRMIGVKNTDGSETYFGARAIDVTASRALAVADDGAVLRVNSASAVTLTVPSSLPDTFSCAVVQYGAGKATLAAGAGVTLRSAGALLSTSEQYATIGLLPLGVDEYAVSGSTGS